MNWLEHFFRGFEKRAAAATKGNTAIGSMPGLRSGLPKTPNASGRLPQASPKSGVTIAARATAPALPTPNPARGASPAAVPKIRQPPPPPQPGGGPASRVTGRGVPSMAI